jgi:hypothetical protein
MLLRRQGGRNRNPAQEGCRHREEQIVGSNLRHLFAVPDADADAAAAMGHGHDL